MHPKKQSNEKKENNSKKNNAVKSHVVWKRKENETTYTIMQRSVGVACEKNCIYGLFFLFFFFIFLLFSILRFMYLFLLRQHKAFALHINFASSTHIFQYEFVCCSFTQTSYVLVRREWNAENK